MQNDTFMKELTENIERMDTIRNMETQELKELIAAYEEGRVKILPKKSEKDDAEKKEVEEICKVLDALFGVEERGNHDFDFGDFLMAVLI